MRQIESLETEIEELETQAQAISEQMHTTNDADATHATYKQNWIKLAIVRKKLCWKWEELSEQV